MQRLKVDRDKSTNPRSILVVDDELAIVQVLQSTLSGKYPRFEFSGSCDPEEAKRLLEVRSYDLLITDLRMPGHDGFELIELARRRHPELPVIVVTGMELPFPSEPVVQVENSIFMQKPLPFGCFLRFVEHILSRPRGQQHFAVCIRRTLATLHQEEADVLVRILEPGKTALLSFRNGEVHFAVSEQHEGAAVLDELMDWIKPEIRLYFQVCNEEDNIESFDMKKWLNHREALAEENANGQ